MADLAFLEAQLATTVKALTAVRRAIEIREQNGDDTADLRALERQYKDDIARLQREIAAFNAALPPGPTSAGETVATGARANDDRADVIAPGSEPISQSPNVGPTSNTNAQKFGQTTSTDINTDAPARPITQTQSLPPITAVPGPASGSPTATTPSIAPQPNTNVSQGGVNDDANGFRPSSQGGVASGNDDSASVNTTGSASVTARINSLFGGDAGRILPQGNALDQYASYTYSISLYLLSPGDYNLMLTRKRTPQGWQLLIQSGGAAVAGGQFQPLDRQEVEQAADGQSPISEPTLGRNQYFPLDFYIDDVKLTCLTTNRGTQSPHNATELEFKIFEPNGITFLPNLYQAVQQYVAVRGGSAYAQNQVWSAQTYLMVIRFYGYDKSGNLVTAGNQQEQITGNDGTVLQSASNATIEKFIPFQFENISFRVENKITEYACKAVTPQLKQNTGVTRGRIPYNIELSGGNLKDILTGPVKVTRDPQDEERDRESSRTISEAPQKTSAITQAQKTTISQGLQDALNRYQAELVAEGIQEYPDIYEIEILEPVIANAQILPPGAFNPRQAAMIQAQTAKQTVDGNTQSVNTNSKVLSAQAGESIVKFLDKALRTSTYVLDQQKYYIDQISGETVKQTPGQVVAWYRIGLQATPTNFIDRKRNDNQYKIKYTIAAYQVNNIKSDYFPRNEFQGTQKLYNYWFTGENTQVLDFKIDFNALFYLVINAPSQPRVTSNYLEADQYYYQPLNPESSQGTENMRVFDGAASAASWLYSPSDQSIAKLTLVGDPAWIFQGEEWSGIQDLNTTYSTFLSDGTINETRGEILFEVAFNNAVDYDLTIGLMDAGKFNYGTNTAARAAGLYDNSPAGLPRARYIYKARQCISHFRKGSFTQELEGTIVTFPINNTQKENTQTTRQNQALSAESLARIPDQSAAETARLLQQKNQNSQTAWDRANISAAATARRQVAASEAYRAAMRRAVAPTSTTQVVGTELPQLGDIFTPDPNQIGSREA